MEYTKEFEIFDFPFWSGAEKKIKLWNEQVIEAAKKCSENNYSAQGKLMDAIQDYIENVFYDRTPSAGEINDFVRDDMDEWFKDYMSNNYPDDDKNEEEE